MNFVAQGIMTLAKERGCAAPPRVLLELVESVDEDRQRLAQEEAEASRAADTLLHWLHLFRRSPSRMNLPQRRPYPQEEEDTARQKDSDLHCNHNCRYTNHRQCPCRLVLNPLESLPQNNSATRSHCSNVEYHCSRNKYSPLDADLQRIQRSHRTGCYFL